MDDKNKVYYIPPNYQNRINLLGLITVSWKNLIQGIIFGGVPSGLFILFIKESKMWNENFISIIILLFALGFIPGVVGIYNGTILSFISIYKNFKKNRRLAIYNPRVKTEYKRDFSNVSKQMLLPKDQIMLWWNERKKNKMDEEAELLEQQIKSGNIKDFYFQDDEGIVDKPIEYMTVKERKEVIKKQKKEERRKIDEQKKEIRRRKEKKNKGKK